MKAVVHDRYGPPEVLEVREIPLPPVTDDDVRVRVRAVALNALDWYFLTGTPYFARMLPKRRILCVDLAGTVDAVGRGVTEFRPGDEVFGVGRGALAEHVCTRTKYLAPKPRRLTFEEAAAMPVAGLTALQGLRDHGRLRPGQRVLVNGASGGVGTFTVQIAKALGAEVTGVCSSSHVDTARSIGADHVVDYTREDFTRSGERYDMVFQVAGSRSWSEYERVMTESAVLVVAVGPRKNGWIGPLGSLARLMVASRLRGRKLAMFIAKVRVEDLRALGEMAEAGALTPVVERYDLSQVQAAFAHLGEGHARGKIVVTFPEDG
jgi:NADPH:quinone reductase-like Zn-dependent oxidoreductase